MHAGGFSSAKDRVLGDARACEEGGETLCPPHPVAVALRSRPQDLGAIMKQGWQLWSAGGQAAAVEIWQAAVAAIPRAPGPRMALAHAARAQNALDRSRDLLEAVLADEPAHFGAQYELVRLMMAMGDLPAARARLDPLLAAHPGQGGLLIEHAELLRQEGATRAAEAALAAVATEDPKAVPARLALGRMLRSRGATVEALAAFQGALALAPHHAGALAECARTLLDAGRADEALAVLRGVPADRSGETRLALLEAEALRVLGRRAEALGRLEPLPSDRQVVVLRLVDQAALDRPPRFHAKAPPGAAESGAALADALAEAAPEELTWQLARVIRHAHPFTVLGTANALLARRTDPEARLAAALAAANAFGTMGATRSALMCIDSFAAEAAALPTALSARLARRHGSALLAAGDRVSATAQFTVATALAPDDAEAGGLLGVLDAGSEAASAEACLALLAADVASPRLRAWLVDRAAALLEPDDPRIALHGLPLTERATSEALLRHNIALARGDASTARGILAGMLAQHDVACPQPEGAPPGMAWFDCPPASLVDGPLVSVVISAHNATPTLPLALSSVLNQSWRNIEVLVVDDASTDSTATMIDGFAARDRRVRPLGMRRNGGTYACRNRAVNEARGAFITFHDADDWMHPKRIETEMAAFSSPSVQAVNSRWFRMNEAGQVRFVPGANPIYANPSFLLFRAETLRRLGSYDGVRASADTEMLWRARMVVGADAIVVLPHILTIGAARPDSLTTNSATGMDMFGYNSLRADYHEAYIRWHQACDANGDVPYLAPGATPPYADRLPAALKAGDLQAPWPVSVNNGPAQP
jgi:tetratricopeptide (TPR) repeat protein